MSKQLDGCLAVGQGQPIMHTHLPVTAKYNPQVCHYKSSTMLNTIYLQGQFKRCLSLQIILKSKTILECNSSLLATSEVTSKNPQAR